MAISSNSGKSLDRRNTEWSMASGELRLRASQLSIGCTKSVSELTDIILHLPRRMNIKPRSLRLEIVTQVIFELSPR